MRERSLPLLLAVIVLSSAPVRAGWDWSHPMPQGKSLRAIRVLGDQDAVAVGDCGTILHWDGWCWLPLRCAPRVSLRAVSDSGPEDLWIAGQEGTLLRGRGREWESVPSGIEEDLYGLHVFGPDSAWAVGAGGACIRWDGSSWSPVATGTDTDLQAVWGATEDDIWAVGSGGMMLHWNGSTWSPVVSGVTETLRAVMGSGGSDVLALGDGYLQPSLIHWDGQGWSPVPIGPQFGMLCSGDGLWLTGPDDIWAVGTGWYPHGWELPFILHWNGAEWDTSSGDEGQFLGIHGQSDSGPVMVGTSGRIARWDGADWRSESDSGWWPVVDIHGWRADQPGILTTLYSSSIFTLSIRWWDGARWTRESIGWDPNQANTLRVGSDGSMVVVGDGGLTYRRSPEGSWTRGNTPGWEYLRALWEVGPGDMFALGMDGVILRGDGLTWESWPGGGTEHLRDAWGWATDGAWAVGDAGTILGWDGTGWSPWASGTQQDLTAVHGLDSELAVAAGDEGTLLRWNGTDWSPMAAPELEDLKAVWVAGPDEIYLTGDDTWLWDGVDWRSIPAPGCGGSDAPYTLWALDGRRLMGGSGRGIYIWDGPPRPVEVRLRISDPWMTPGDELWLRAYLENQGPDDLLDVPAVFLLEAYGELYTWPSWAPYRPGDLEHGLVNIPVGGTALTVLAPMTWPDTGPDSTSDLRWYGALLSPDGTELLGEWDVLGWGFGPE